MRVLIVEDEPKTAKFLRTAFVEMGWSAFLAKNGEEGLQQVRQSSYDIILLDISLPQRDGWSVLSEMRREGKMTPVIFLTARDEIGDRVKGLDLGADDYLVKPFALTELLARIRSILRRGPERQSVLLRIADLEIDLSNARVSRAGIRLDLTAKEYGLLVFLTQNAGEVVGRKSIGQRVWEMEWESDTNLVDTLVKRLRRKLDHPFEKALIHSVYGVGYLLEERQ